MGVETERCVKRGRITKANAGFWTSTGTRFY
jgi:hypothetical protein